MTIEQAIVATGAGITLFRLLALRGMVRMESHGMKTRGGAIRPRIAEELGLRARATYADFLNRIEELIAAIKSDIKEEQHAG